MTQQEYDQNKRECFVKFCKDNGIDQELNISIFDAFDQIFDRAYALGREKETITQEEIEKVAKEYVLTRQQARHNAKREEDATLRDFDKSDPKNSLMNGWSCSLTFTNTACCNNDKFLLNLVKANGVFIHFCGNFLVSSIISAFL